jgi:hypothetical protein
MSTSPDSLMRAAFAPARELEPTDAEVSAVLRRSRRRARVGGGRLRLALAAVAATVAVGGGAYAVPVTRAAIQDVADTFAGWAGGDDAEAPGRPVAPGDDVADYMRAPRYGAEPRVIAEADGYTLVASRDPNGGVTFDLGNTGVGIGGPLSSYAGHAVHVLGPGSVEHADEHGHVPLFGLTAKSVESVELVYPSGPPLRVAGVDGAFVLLADPTRNPEAVVAYDAGGDEVGRASLHDSEGVSIDWSRYGPPAERVPARCLPGAVGLSPPPDCPNG